MKNINDLGPKDAIHCPTPELAKKIIELNGDAPYDFSEHNDFESMVYIPFFQQWTLKSIWELLNNTTHQASEFLPSGEEDADIKRLKNLLNELNKQPMTFVHDPLTEDQKFFRELVVGLCNKAIDLEQSDWPNLTIEMAKDLFTAVKKHENGKV
jgi:hypothetical protein